MKEIVISCLSQSGSLPEYQTVGSAGADVCAHIPRALTLSPGERRLIPTGLQLQIPPGYEAQVRPRSGLALRNGVTMVNAPGTIDSDYRGEVGILLINLGAEDFTVEPGDRIAQLVFAPVTRAEFVVRPQLDQTTRGQGGFGSTGV